MQCSLIVIVFSPVPTFTGSENLEVLINVLVLFFTPARLLLNILRTNIYTYKLVLITASSSIQPSFFRDNDHC